MTNTEYSCTIVAGITPKQACDTINHVAGWWVTEVDGSSQKLGDEFAVHFGTTWVAFKITEALPYEKIVWAVTDCNLPWNSDIKEWNGTKIIWEIAPLENGTQITFTHVGLAMLNCGNQCITSWGGYIKQSLFKLITEGKGLPNKF